MKIKAVLLLSILMSGNFSNVFSQAGSLDLSFDSDGIVTTPIGSSYEGAYAVMIQPDGKIVAAGYSSSGSLAVDFAVVRYNSNGSLDTTFSNDGKTTTDFGSISDYATSAFLQPDGKIVVCGRTYINGNSNYGCAIARYNTDGSLDNSFDSDGMVSYDFSSFDDIMLESAIQPDGKILVCGYSFTGSHDEFVILRFEPNGTIDNTFGTGGAAVISFGNGYARCSDVGVLQNGKILSIGRVYNPSVVFTSDFALAQLNSNGTLDNSFGISGKVVTDFAGLNDWGETFIIQPDGKIVATGYTGDVLTATQFAMIRYDSSGAIDIAFGINGKVTTAFSNQHDESYAISLQPDLKIILAGRSYNGSDNDFGIARYTSSGVLDNSFDVDGKVTVPIGTWHDEAFAIALQQDGKIVLGGRAYNADEDFALIRLNNEIPTSTHENSYTESNRNLLLFPNPASDFLIISHNFDSSDESEISVYDMTGRIISSHVIRQKKFQLDIKNLIAGIYICKVENSKQKKSMLFSKTK